MDNSILTGKYIRRMLVENEELMELIDQSKIFPLIANADTTFPFIVYSRDSLIPVYTKNLLSDNTVSFTIIVVSDDYIQSLNIANAVRHALEGQMYKDEYLTIYPIRINSINENTLSDAYLQTIRCSFSTN